VKDHDVFSAFTQGFKSPTRVARIVELSTEHIVLHEGTAGVVIAAVYRRNG